MNSKEAPAPKKTKIQQKLSYFLTASDEANTGEVALPDTEYVHHSEHESEASSDTASVHDSESESTIRDSESESKSEKKIYTNYPFCWTKEQWQF